MYYFSIAAVRNYPKFGGLKQHTFLLLLFGGQKSEMGLTELKSRCQQHCCPFGGSLGEPLPCLFQLPGLPTFWFLASNHIPSFITCPCLPLPLRPLAFTSKDAGDSFGPIWMILDKLPSPEP